MSIKSFLKQLAFLLLVFLVAASFTSFKTTASNTPDSHSSLPGTWKLLDGEYVNDKGEVKRYADLKMTALKVLDKNHFSFISMADGKFWASGAGTYTVNDDQYQETLNLASFTQNPNERYVFTFRIDGDVWMLERFNEQGKRVELERWQRQ